MQHQTLSEIDPSDPFSAGQMVGMLVVLMYLEQNNGIAQEFLQQLKNSTAQRASEYLDQPVEDVLLYIDTIIKEMNHENH